MLGRGGIGDRHGNGRITIFGAKLLQVIEHVVEAHRAGGVDGFHNAHLDEDFARGRTAQLIFALGKHLENARGRSSIGQLGLLNERTLLRLGNFQQRHVALGNLKHH